MRAIDNAAEASVSATEAGWRERRIINRLARIDTGRLTLTLSSGQTLTFNGAYDGPEADIHIHSPRLATRLLTTGSVGFAESYMAGEWRSHDLANLIYLLHLNASALQPDWSKLGPINALADAWRGFRARNSRRGARRNIAYHYDLGNDFYARWLDETWTYSAAVFASPTEDLATAQRRKYQRLLDCLDVRPGAHILEIGCGWGGFALYAAHHAGVHVTGITLSEEQLDFAQARAVEAGLDDYVTFELRDYRDVLGQYDHVVSIEMYEAVGETYWPAYFDAIRRALVPGGRAALQAITIDANRFAHYRRRLDFIQKYIFPGGMLASPEVFVTSAADQGLSEHQRAFFGADYARTLMRWDASVHTAAADITVERGETFYRMWRYYLAYCAAGFTSGNIDLMQIVLSKPET